MLELIERMMSFSDTITVLRYFFIKKILLLLFVKCSSLFSFLIFVLHLMLFIFFLGLDRSNMSELRNQLQKDIFQRQLSMTSHTKCPR
jgi:sensor domain CHASE-containing protein